MTTKKEPTIRPAAQARLLLYRLFSQYIGQTQSSILDTPPSQWEKILEKIEQIMLGQSNYETQKRILTQAFMFIEKASNRDLKRQLQKILGEPLWLGVFPQGLLDDFIKEHTQLLKNVGQEHLNKIAETLRRGLRQGLLQKDMEKEIRHQTGLSKKSVRLIARNVPLQYSGALAKYHQQQAGIKKYRWQTSGDERVRSSHRDKNNIVYSWNSAGPHPREEVNCRCDAVPVLD